MSRLGSVRAFWQRVSEGRELEDLWQQFASEARAGYGLYSQDVDWEAIHQASRWRRPFRVAKALFLAMLMKMTPARRVLLLVAVGLLLLAGLSVQFISAGRTVQIGFLKTEWLAAAVLFLLLALELADRVTMKRDLEIAREIQHWLVPAAPPAVPGVDIAFATRPANTVAGDYYDAFLRPAPDGAGQSASERLMVVVADVAGKSVPAALLMATFQASLRALASLPGPIGELVKSLNGYACAHSLGGRRFTTAVLAEYDPASRMLTYVNAGHNAPVLRRSSGRIERLEAGGLPLGIEPEAIYVSGATALESGDLLVIFTDGVAEAVNEAGEEFGERRLLDWVCKPTAAAAAATLAGLMEAVDGFVQTARQHDDITCLVMRVA